MNRQAFYASLRARGSGVFGTSLKQGQVDGIEGILTAFDAVGDGNRDTLAYALATAYHETGARMIPVREGFATTDAGARRAVEKLAQKRGPKSAVARYSQPAGPFGHVYYGRGQAQLTWLDNYRTASADAGVDLVKDPDAMLDPVISARVLIRGIMDGRWNGRGKGIRFYAEADGNPDMDDDDLIAARRTVNVQDKAELIAGYARAFEAALVAAEWGAKPAPILELVGKSHNPAFKVLAEAHPSQPITTPYPPDRQSPWAAIINAVIAIWKGLRK